MQALPAQRLTPALASGASPRSCGLRDQQQRRDCCLAVNGEPGSGRLQRLPLKPECAKGSWQCQVVLLAKDPPVP